MPVPVISKTTRSTLTGVYAGCAVTALSVTACLPIGEANSTNLDISILRSAKWVDVAALEDRKPVSLEFKNNASVNGHAGCNGYFGAFEIKAQSVAFKYIGSTRMMCEPESMDTEIRYLKALESTRSARIDKGVLELRDAQGKVLWRFKRLD